MTWLAASLYILGVIGAAAAVWRDEPAGLREWVIIAIWPVVVAWVVASAPFRARVRP